MMHAQALLAEGINTLKAAGIEDSARDARWLLAYALGIERDRLTLALHDPVTADQETLFRQAIMARTRHQPVAQIIGARLFWGRSFQVSPDVLDPRPETETLVEAALRHPVGRVLDLGTGSGAILLTLLAERPEATGLGVDLSPNALEVARQNAEALGLSARARFVHSDWFSEVEGEFDLIVSNPPYIAATDFAGLAPEVRDWEPHMALVPNGCDGSGLAAYRVIAAQAPKYLAAQGWLMVEIGVGQGADVLALFTQAGLKRGQILPDLSGRGRVVVAQA
ncbi:peptide chain release factor N(5)-glutamine methyltransferase [Roseinatronobacter bogoriensis subsp. barguzinensis]|uniref:Release factor glutamine methyltransferase n=2 Tax=Roseinatronobacter bogoriensis TaxID=119542 RepID=A0A2K8KAU2_9RHOB|nr:MULTISPECIES: peptide chain release factor N(5)-glutamine methyltransferase [Rhodobaca]ATX66571.1 peptide chain release factor N(5)-glutamine methyltransferase [Rhodobaca barguzinensis]MBB4207739.1 release factor glutamine methyltransferase [Rhodobaca bogoriensis DSM 18756]